MDRKLYSWRVQGDLNSADDLARAFKGAYAVFAITDSWSVVGDLDKEVQQGKTMADVAVAAGVELYIFSGAPRIKGNSPMNNSKSLIEEYIMKLPMKTAIVWAAFFHSNFTKCHPPRVAKDGVVEFIVPIIQPEFKLHLISAGDEMGPITVALLNCKNIDRYLNRAIFVTPEALTLGEIADIYTKVTGTPTRAVFLPDENLDFVTPEWTLMFKEMAAEKGCALTDYNWDSLEWKWPGGDEFEAVRELLGLENMMTWEKWLRKSGWNVLDPKFSNNFLCKGRRIFAFTSILILGRKVAIVTGAGANIGLAVATAYAEAGADVAIWYNGNPAANDRAAEIAEALGVRCRAYKCNVKLFGEVEGVIKQVVHDFGKVDIFVANAGVVQDPEYVIDGNPALWDDIITVNYTSVVSCAAVVGRYFKERGHGIFIATASCVGWRSARGGHSAIYDSLKSGVHMFCRSLAYEWKDFARVNSVSPGYFGDGMGATGPEMEHALHATVLGRFADYKELKGAYLFLASDASSFTTGTDICVDGGFSI
ncbi:hypothetical protein P7C73_g2939, partial [Tremellales sp. Uapishka_1]